MEANVDKDQTDHTEQDEENSPHSRTPESHRGWVKREVFEETHIEVCELEADEEERGAPDEEVVVEDLHIGVRLARVLLDGVVNFPEVVHARQRME